VTTDFDIVRAAHVEFLVTDLERSKEFYVDTLGFVETSSDRSHIYLRGLEDRFHHCLVLTKAEKPAIGHMAFRVREEDHLEKISKLFSDAKLPVKWLKPQEEPGQGRAFRAQDPLGFPVEFFKEMDAAEWMLQRFDEHRRAKIQRIDHFNVLVPNVSEASKWYVEKLGFLCSEFTETDEKEIWATWLRRKPTVHDIAIMTGAGPRLHHVGFSVSEKDDILDCADILASQGYIENMERGPGRHGISNAFFLYLRDPDGHRIELYTGDYLSADPDWEPLKWNLNDPQRQTFWGAPAPEKWFKEASPVLSVFEGRDIPTKAPKHDARMH
jgi:catechol 2,3-dioxygenase